MARRKNLRVAIVSDSLLKWGGMAEELKAILEEFPTADLYTVISDKKFLEEKFPNVKVKNSFIQYLPFEKFFRKELFLLYPLAYRLFNFRKYDAVLSISISFAKFIRTPKNVPHINICLSPPKFFWQKDDRSIKDMDRASFKFYSFFQGTFLERIWQRWDRNAARRVDQMYPISETVASRVKDFYDLDTEVIYPPVNTHDVKYNSNIHSRENWFLYLGRVETYKGVELAIRAAVQADLPLKIAGTGEHLEQMQELIHELNAKGLVKLLGYVSDEKKFDLLYRCRGLIFPVRGEDFGIVPVEANASGAPVIAYRDGGVTETISEKDPRTGVFFDEYTPNSLAQVLESYDLDDYDPDNCRKQASQFDKEIFKYRLKTVVEDAVKER